MVLKNNKDRIKVFKHGFENTPQVAKTRKNVNSSFRLLNLIVKLIRSGETKALLGEKLARQVTDYRTSSLIAEKSIQSRLLGFH